MSGSSFCALKQLREALRCTGTAFLMKFQDNEDAYQEMYNRKHRLGNT